MLKVMFLSVVVACVSGCSTVGYYVQAIQGHLGIVSASKPVGTLLESPRVDEGLKRRLRLTQQARAFAVETLGLPDNGSYTRYADLDRAFVTWNVVATPADSLVPVQHCFWVVGCLSYRGYFSESDARTEAARYEHSGHDVYVSGAAAYSTIGWFEDPLVSTMFLWSDSHLVGVLFHELAHQKLYVEGDSAFNESFATAVQLVGLEQWFESRGDQQGWKAYQAWRQRSQKLNGLVMRTRARLQVLYEGRSKEMTPLMEKKHRVFQSLHEEYEALKRSEQWGDQYDQWMSEPWNNARLALFATYEQWVPAFYGLAKQHGGLSPEFYKAASELGALPEQERTAALAHFTKMFN